MNRAWNVTAGPKVQSSKGSFIHFIQVTCLPPYTSSQILFGKNMYKYFITFLQLCVHYILNNTKWIQMKNCAFAKQYAMVLGRQTVGDSQICCLSILTCYNFKTLPSKCLIDFHQHAVTGRPWVNNNSVYWHYRWNTTVVNTKHFTRISRPTWQLIQYSYNQYSGLIALAPVSNTVLHRFASTLRNALSSYDLPSLCRPLSFYAIRKTLPRREKKTDQFLPFPGRI